MKYRVGFVGSGNVAWHLSHALDSAGHDIVQIISKTESNAKELAEKFGSFYSTDLSYVDNRLDVCICCVSDDQLSIVAESLVNSKTFIVHTCGSQPMDILKNASTNFGVFYPLQSFTKGQKTDMLQVPFMLEASNNRSLSILNELADSISNKVSFCDSTTRLKYHLSAVFVNNFVNRLYSEAYDYLESNELDFDVLKPIILETARKVQRTKPKDAQTGPAKRGDVDTISKHKELLVDNSELAQLYDLLTKTIGESFTKRD